MINASSSPTLMTLGKRRAKSKEEPLSNPSVYRSLIGGLQFLTNTIPDISFAVNQISLHLGAPTTLNWQKAKQIMRYLKGTLEWGLHIKPSLDLTLVGFLDADWANSVIDRRSIGGYCVFLGESLVSWSSKKQGVVSRLSAESGYRTLASLASEIS